MAKQNSKKQLKEQCTKHNKEKLKTGQQEPHLKPEVILGALEGLAYSTLHVKLMLLLYNPGSVISTLILPWDITKLIQ